MVRTIISVVLVIVLVIGCVWMWRIVNHEQVPGSGEVVVRSNPEHDQMESGTTYIDNKPIEAHPTPSRSDNPGTINTEPVAEYGKASSNDVETTQYGATSQSQTADQPSYKSATVTPYPSPAQAAPAYATTSFSTDSIPANPPNGVGFAGTGPYQWYRQGDLTWRIDTKSGVSCIDYATMDEWRKPIVYSHGCGGSSRWHHRER